MDMTPLATTATAGAVLAAGPARAGENSGNRGAREVAEDFEAFFISMYLDAMFSGVETEGLFGGGQAETVYRSLLNQEVGKAIAEFGGLGIADNVMREIIKMQEAK